MARVVGSLGRIAFPSPDLTDHLTLPFVDLLTRPTVLRLLGLIFDQTVAATGAR
jgi:hypothetical protein